jgi:hypothetical protein
MPTDREPLRAWIEASGLDDKLGDSGKQRSAILDVIGAASKAVMGGSVQRYTLRAALDALQELISHE